MKAIIQLILIISLLVSTSFELKIIGNYDIYSEQQLQSLYTQYLETFKESPHSQSYSFEAFKANIEAIEVHNSHENSQYKQGINQFTGILMMKSSEDDSKVEEKKKGNVGRYPSVTGLPTFWDWRQRRIIGDVKDQGNGTNEGWIFASISALEAKYAMKYNQNISLSAQQIRDCNTADNGSWAGWTVFQLVAFSGGIALSEHYPDTAGKQSCYFNFTIPAVQTYEMGYDWVVNEDETYIQQAVMNKGPVAAGFRVSDDFIKYTQGIYYSKDCDKNLPTHTLLIIGWGTENGIDFWLVQNSWGTSWGEQGYAKIQRNTNTCGIADYGAVPREVYDPSIDLVRPFQIHSFNFDNEARCLDGSMYSIYFSPGSGDGLNKTVAYFEGGGWCEGRSSDQVLASCLQRSTTDLGSSFEYPMEADYDYVFRGDPSDDFFFSNWNKFVIKYCDGGRHQSYKKNNVTVNGTALWFRGHQNVINALNYIAEKVPIELTDTFALIGCSAGGLATYMWTDYFKDFVYTRNPSTTYWALPDSAFYVEYNNVQTGDNSYKVQMQNLFATVNEVNFPNAACAKAHPNEQHLCFITEYMIPYIVSPLFIVQSAYDAFQIPNILGVQCLPLYKCSQLQMTQIQQYRDHQQQVIKNALIAKSNSAVWSISCSFHCYWEKGNSENAQRLQTPFGSGVTYAAALRMFLAGIKDQYEWRWQDNQPWPMNTDCAFWQTEDLISSCKY